MCAAVSILMELSNTYCLSHTSSLSSSSPINMRLSVKPLHSADWFLLQDLSHRLQETKIFMVISWNSRSPCINFVCNSLSCILPLTIFFWFKWNYALKKKIWFYCIMHRTTSGSYYYWMALGFSWWLVVTDPKYLVSSTVSSKTGQSANGRKKRGSEKWKNYCLIKIFYLSKISLIAYIRYAIPSIPCKCQKQNFRPWWTQCNLKSFF